MADNVAITAGTGTTVAADEVVDGTLGTVKVQFVKIMDGTLDGTSKAAVGSGGLAVDTEMPAAAALADGASNPTSPIVGAGLLLYNGSTWDRARGDSNKYLQIRNRPSVVRTRVASSGLTTASTSYSVGDQAGTMLSFTGAATATGGTGTIMSAVLLDKADVGTDYRLHFFRSNVTLASDNAAFAISDTDAQDHCGIVTMPSMLDIGNNRVSTLGNIGLAYDTGAGTTLYVAIETRSTNGVYGAVTDLNLTLTLLLD